MIRTAISPENPAGLTQTFARATELGSLTPVESKSVYPSFVVTQAWESGVARYLWLTTLFLNLGLFIWASLIIPSTPRVALGPQFVGSALETVPSSQLIIFPVASLLLAVAGWIAGLYFYRWEKERVLAVKRLRIITPDHPEVVPLNLLAIPDFTWAGNAIVQIGRRIWDDYWGPRMQAALLGLFRLAHVWNQHHPGAGLGLLHVVFMAFNKEWRHKAMALLPPGERMGALALDALLGQTGEGDKWSQGWVTEVISPVLSKVMALELSPWLFSAMHQERFVDMNRWVEERAWIVLRLPSGEMGREGARLTASVLYNVFDAAYRRATLEKPVPFYFIVDEAQEIGSGMRLESMLAEGAKFGARMFVLAQSLSLMRKVEGMEPVVQALLANTSTQMFFSPAADFSSAISPITDDGVMG